MENQTEVKQEENEGILYIKPEFVVKVEGNEESPSKKPKLDGEVKVKAKGQFKNRYNKNKLNFDPKQNLCNVLIDVPEDAEILPECKNSNCKHLHDVGEYLKSKPPDIADECYIFKARGHCPRGLTCRFGKCHITENGRNRKNENFKEGEISTKNFITKEVQSKLWKKTYDFSKSSEILKNLPNYRDNSKLKDKNLDLKNGTEKPIGFSFDDDLFKLHLAEKKKN